VSGAGPRAYSTPGSVLRMTTPGFRLVCTPSALTGAPAGWAREMLRDGEIALLAAEGLGAVNDVAHNLGLFSLPVVRSETSAELQDQTVMAYGDALPLIWIAPGFSDDTLEWARTRGQMTLLVESEGTLASEDRRRIDRFVAILGRQSE
jgi:hypothetical protein